ncbi:hypothetical protein GEMRC1_001632 [Eukaryota sp. GEM-RC1]
MSLLLPFSFKEVYDSLCSQRNAPLDNSIILSLVTDPNSPFLSGLSFFHQRDASSTSPANTEFSNIPSGTLQVSQELGSSLDSVSKSINLSPSQTVYMYSIHIKFHSAPVNFDILKSVYLNERSYLLMSIFKMFEVFDDPSHYLHDFLCLNIENSDLETFKQSVLMSSLSNLIEPVKIPKENCTADVYLATESERYFLLSIINTVLAEDKSLTSNLTPSNLIDRIMKLEEVWHDVQNNAELTDDELVTFLELINKTRVSSGVLAFSCLKDELYHSMRWESVDFDPSLKSKLYELAAFGISAYSLIFFVFSLVQTDLRSALLEFSGRTDFFIMFSNFLKTEKTRGVYVNPIGLTFCSILSFVSVISTAEFFDTQLDSLCLAFGSNSKQLYIIYCFYSIDGLFFEFVV